MEGDKLIEEVKCAIGLTGNYQDKALSIYINDIKDYLISAGVKESTINSKRATGVIVRGVIDTWDLGGGNGKLSNYFYERVIQLANYNEIAKEVESDA